MRAALLVTMICLAMPAAASAQFPAGAEIHEAQLLTKMGPQTRAWIVHEAATKGQQSEFSESAASAAVRSDYPNLGSLRDMDVEVLVFMVMMQAAKDAQNDLKEMLSGVVQINKAKAALRDAEAANKRLATAPRGLTPAGPTVATPRALDAQVIQPKPLPRAEFDLKLAAVQNNRDGLEQMAQTEEFRLKLGTDRQSRLMVALGNMMKSMAQTDASLVKNMP